MYAEAALYQKVRGTYMKYKIEKNTVQETLIIPLYSRKLCSELYPNIYRDETAVRLLDQIDYDFSEAEKNVPCDLNDTTWFSQIDASEPSFYIIYF